MARNNKKSEAVKKQTFQEFYIEAISNFAADKKMEYTELLTQIRDICPDPIAIYEDWQKKFPTENKSDAIDPMAFQLKEMINHLGKIDESIRATDDTCISTANAIRDIAPFVSSTDKNLVKALNILNELRDKESCCNCGSKDSKDEEGSWNPANDILFGHPISNQSKEFQTMMKHYMNDSKFTDDDLRVLVSSYTQLIYDVENSIYKYGKAVNKHSGKSKKIKKAWKNLNEAIFRLDEFNHMFL